MLPGDVLLICCFQATFCCIPTTLCCMHPGNVLLHPINDCVHSGTVPLHPNKDLLHPGDIRMHPGDVLLLCCIPTTFSCIPTTLCCIPSTIFCIRLLYPDNDLMQPGGGSVASQQRVVNDRMHPGNVEQRSCASRRRNRSCPRNRSYRLSNSSWKQSFCTILLHDPVAGSCCKILLQERYGTDQSPVTIDSTITADPLSLQPI